MPVDEVLLIDAAEVCRRMSIGISSLHAMRRSGRFPLATVKLGRSVKYHADELRRWVESGCPAESRWRMLMQAGAIGKRAGRPTKNRRRVRGPNGGENHTNRNHT